MFFYCKDEWEPEESFSVNYSGMKRRSFPCTKTVGARKKRKIQRKKRKYFLFASKKG